MTIRTLLSRAGATLAPAVGSIAIWSSVGLAASLGTNVWLLGKWGEARARAKAEIAAAVERGRAEAAEKHASQQQALVQLAELDRSLLLQDLREIAERSRQARVVYRDRIASLPVAACAPGQERMDAVNELVTGK
jgi:hypothetical protein